MLEKNIEVFFREKMQVFHEMRKLMIYHYAVSMYEAKLYMIQNKGRGRVVLGLLEGGRLL